MFLFIYQCVGSVSQIDEVTHVVFLLLFYSQFYDQGNMSLYSDSFADHRQTDILKIALLTTRTLYLSHTSSKSASNKSNKR